MQDRQGFLGHLSETEKETLRVIKAELSPESLAVMQKCKIEHEPDDCFLLRYCRARKFQKAEVVEMLDTHFKWYRSYRLEPLMRQSEEEILGCDPTMIHALYPRVRKLICACWVRVPSSSDLCLSRLFINGGGGVPGISRRRQAGPASLYSATGVNEHPTSIQAC